MNALPRIYLPTKLEYIPQFVRIRIFRVLANKNNSKVTLAISGRDLPSRLTVDAESFLLPEGVSIDSEGYFLYQGKRISLWDKIPVGLNAQIIHAKLPPHYTAKWWPEIDISL